jgi:hypothetical protein
VPLRAHDLLRAPGPPDGALAQQPVGGQPARDQHRRGPPLVPEQDQRRGDAAAELDDAVRYEGHARADRRGRDTEVEVAREREVVGEVGLLQVRDARRLICRREQPLMQVRSDSAAQVRADRVVDRAQHEDEDRRARHDRQRPARSVAGADRADQRAGRDDEHAGQGGPHDDQRPPGPCQPAVCARQHPEHQVPFRRPPGVSHTTFLPGGADGRLDKTARSFRSLRWRRAIRRRYWLPGRRCRAWLSSAA